MKKITIVVATLLVITVCNAQVNLVLQPNAVAGKDAMLNSYWPTTNMGSTDELNAEAWTQSSVSFVQRGLVEFDLSSIPSTALIQSAHLTLYNNPTSINGTGDGTHSYMSGSNESVVQRVTSSWQESTVTWSTQPSATTLNEVTLLQNTSPHQDYVLDVTALVQDMVNSPSTSFGFLLQLVTEQYYRCMLFASSDHANSALHPKLEITYYPVCTNVVLQPNAAAGKDAMLNSYWPTTNMGSTDELNTEAWTQASVSFVQRGLIEFDLSAIPSTALIQSAYLTLYNNPTSINGTGDGTHSYMSGSNESVIERVTSSWQESTVTWNTQPSATTVNEVTLLQNTSPHQDYVSDVTALVQDMINNPTSSFGFMLKLVTEQYYRCMLFASSDHANSALHPKLEICYVDPNSVNEINNNNDGMNLFPNPATNELRVYSSEFGVKSVEVFDVMGERLTLPFDFTQGNARINISSLASGIYFVKVRGEKEERIGKFVKQ